MSIDRVVALGVLALAFACNKSDPQPVQFSDVHVSAVFNAPSNVSCILLVASSPSKTVTRTFDVTSGQSTATLVMNGIPTGNVMFSGLAFDVACGFVDSTTVPTWVADDVTTKVNAGSVASVRLNFHGNASAIVAADFGGDDYTVTTIAGTGGSAGTADGVGGAARFSGPNDLALSADGNTLFVGDRNDGIVPQGMAIRAVDLRTGAVTTIAGSLSAGGTADGPGATARFDRLFAVALSGGNLLISDRCAIRSMSTTPPFTVTTLVGTRAANPARWNCSPSVTPLGAQDLDLAVRGTDVYVADSTHFVIHKVAFSSSPPAITTVVGIPDVPGSDDGTVATAHLLGPNAVTFPFVGDDLFYLVDVSLTATSVLGLIRRVSLSEDSVTTVAGAPQAAFVSNDGLGTQATFAQPRRAVSDGRSLFIGDAFSVRRMDLSTAAVVTIAGDTATAAFADGVGSAARFNAAFGVARDPRNGVIYIADQGNFAIRKLTPP